MNIPVRLVLMPEGTPFHSWYGPGVDDRLMTLLSDVANTYHAPLIDARQWLSDELFSDGHHMLAAGAKQFTERLCREVIRPAVTAR
jgi:hypothetical protein